MSERHKDEVGEPSWEDYVAAADAMADAISGWVESIHREVLASPAYQALLEAAETVDRYRYEEDILEPEWDVFV